jgi:predicted dehydrogenase
LILRYLKTQAVLMPSWNWSFSRKDMEVYGTGGYAITVGSDKLRVRYRGQGAESQATAAPLLKAESSSLNYLAGVLRGQVNPAGDLSSLETNMVVMQILDAGRQSAQTGRTIAIMPLPK